MRTLKMTVLTLAAGLALAGCGGGGEADSATIYRVDGFDVTAEDAPVADLSEYGTDLEALYASIGVTDCEQGLAERDISGAIYLDCGGDLDIRIHPDAESAEAAVEALADVETRTTYVSGPYVIKGDEAAVEAFIAERVEG